jgi:hypothetical protein
MWQTFRAPLLFVIRVGSDTAPRHRLKDRDSHHRGTKAQRFKHKHAHRTLSYQYALMLTYYPNRHGSARCKTGHIPGGCSETYLTL